MHCRELLTKIALYAVKSCAVNFRRFQARLPENFKCSHEKMHLLLSRAGANQPYA